MNRKEIENVECINFEEIQHKISRFYELANSLNYEVKKNLLISGQTIDL